MKPVKLIAGKAKSVIYDESYDYIGVDKGAWVCFSQGIPMVFAIGDFDSITRIQLDQIKKSCQVIELSSHKNETDSEAAIMYAKQMGYEDIYLYGALGGRMDHAIANLYLMLYRDDKITLEDEHQVLKKVSKGTYSLEKKFHYLSLLALEDSIVTIQNVAYPLLHQTITKKDIYTISNEILDHACLIVEEGSVLLIQSEDE